ncbi:TonB-dependent receptor domain-containing protein [Tenacibaculum xiamenense]|uniref:TonB-dependent receptor domain-containing protein n=1 Tax=Tenacibaculum xiamenense TaxID=1261553 RepID=UPI003895CFF2
MTRILVFNIFFWMPIISFAQLYSGVVKDATTQESIPYATIGLYKETVLVDGTSSNERGQFQIKNNKEATHIEVSFMGYEIYKILISEILDYQNMNVVLQPSKNELNEVVVQAERTTTQLKIDRKIVNLGTDLQQSGATALEAFDQISEIQTDLGTGSLSLRGSGNVRLLINGKPSAMNSMELLDQIPASSIQRVEIITSPSAKNQADGLSGIINIIFKKNINQGLNLNLNSSVGTKRYQVGFDGNYNTSIVNFRLQASHGERRMDSKQWIYQKYANGNTRDFYAPHDFNGKVTRVTSGLDFFFDEKNELSFEVSYTHDFHSFFNDTYYTNVTGRNDYLYTRNSSHTHKTAIYNVNYRRKFSEDGHFLELDYNVNDNKNILPASDFEDDSFLFDEEQSNKNNLHALAIDYTVPSEKITIEAGTSWNHRKLTSFNNFVPSGGIAVNDIFNYKENLLGIYGLTKFKTGKLNWQTGLRYEYFSSNSDNTMNGQTTDLSFSNLFPSIHLSYELTDKNTLNTGYSKRVSRPNFNHINPFRMGNQYFQWNANPSLKPEFADSFEVNYQYDGEKLNLSIDTFYRYRTDVIQWLQVINDEGVRIVSFDNVGKRNTYGIETNTHYKINSFWNTQLSANYYYSKAKQPNITWTDLYSSNIILKNTFKICKSITTDITYTHVPKRQDVFSQTQPRNRFDLAARANFLDNRLTASFRIVDVLDNNLRKRKLVLTNVVQNETWRFQSQTFGWMFTLNYKLFQNQGKTRNRKQRNYNHGGAIE